jgi:hypothetical protein
MANEQNLTPFNQMPAELHRELSARGGRASGAARRAKRERIEQAKATQRAESEILQEQIELYKLIFGKRSKYR